MMEIPRLAEGEIYCGAILNANGNGHHIILLAGDNDNNDWQAQMNWAKSIGGDLPSRVEQALLYDCLRDRFPQDFYWSNEQHESSSNYAWGQYFYYGLQGLWSMYDDYRARAVRRVAI